jgi:hypothetical protein
MDEPSVLDYIKAKLTPWRGPAPQVPPIEVSSDPSIEKEAWSPDGITPQVSDRSETAPILGIVPWRTLGALLLALFAQGSFEPSPDRSWVFGAFLYGIAILLFAWAYLSKEWVFFGDQEQPRSESWLRDDAQAMIYNPTYLLVSLIFTLVGLWLFRDNRFNLFNLMLWLAALVLIIKAFWVEKNGSLSWIGWLRDFLARPGWRIDIQRGFLPLLAAIALVIFFRVYRLGEVPPQMVSDHAEKLLDVWDVLQGQTAVFFTRNTGREGLQMYLTAAVVRLTGLELNFLSMKIGTVLAGLLTLPYLYLLGNEVGNSRRVGFLAILFGGIAYWPNVISRVALRFSLYPLFVAPVLYYLVRGLRTSNRNDFILAGLFLGIGLHGYTPIRILPVLVIVGVGLYLLHKGSAGLRRLSIFHLLILALVAVVAFLPLLSYALQNPDTFGYRAFTRLGTIERPLPGPALPIFLDNLWNALTMFAWDNGNIWLVSIGHRPALDLVSGALFHLGIVLLVVRYLYRRRWQDLFLLLSIPLLMLPSILSLAFPEENPALNRASGALVPVFVVVGIALDSFLKALEQRFSTHSSRLISYGLVGLLLLLSATQNYSLVFGRYQAFYEAVSWNTTELGQAIRDFSNTIGDPDSAWVLAFPHWVDTRLVGMHAGRPTKDYAIFPDELSSTLVVPGPKLFLVHPNDEEGQSRLEAFYPEGWLQVYDSQVETKDFLLFFVPPEGY